MITFKDGFFEVYRPTDDEIRKLDARLKRVSPGVLKWHPPEEEPMRVNYDADSHTFWIPRPDAETEARLDAEHERIPGHLRWRAPGERVTLSKVKDAAVAVLSGRLEVDDPIVQQRLKSCMGGDGQPRCTALVTEGDGSWCKACGCGKTKMAEIDGSPTSKLTFRTLKCPRFMPGFSNARD
jgi:hypothetical protein